MTATAGGPVALFDLDGTLVRPGSVLQRLHMDAMASAIGAAVGTREPFVYRGGEMFYRDVNLAGFTDSGTVLTALRLAGVPVAEAAEQVPAVVAVMVERLEWAVTPEGWRGSDDLLPGAREVLEALAGAGFVLGMSTGNARAVAAWKMRWAGLSDLLRDGGFGDEATEREDVARAGAAALALAGAAPHGVLVGDTTRDITAAHAAGLGCLAVTTGAATAAELRVAGADAVVPGLCGGRVLDALFRVAGHGASPLTPALPGTPLAGPA
ncbi:HAD family hydrolase [Streptomyces sp. NPDC059913]|uniref:HAD family hydrolase n=1 Tax=unclassified Streptomyces TaxID=2593676 RepID=UPI003662D985